MRIRRKEAKERRNRGPTLNRKTIFQRRGPTSDLAFIVRSSGIVVLVDPRVVDRSIFFTIISFEFRR